MELDADIRSKTKGKSKPKESSAEHSDASYSSEKKVVILTKKKRKKQVVAKENLQSLKSNIFSFLFFKINYLGNQKSKKQTKRIKI